MPSFQTVSVWLKAEVDITCLPTVTGCFCSLPSIHPATYAGLASSSSLHLAIVNKLSPRNRHMNTAAFPCGGLPCLLCYTAAASSAKNSLKRSRGVGLSPVLTCTQGSLAGRNYHHHFLYSITASADWADTVLFFLAGAVFPTCRVEAQNGNIFPCCPHHFLPIKLQSSSVVSRICSKASAAGKCLCAFFLSQCKNNSNMCSCLQESNGAFSHVFFPHNDPVTTARLPFHMNSCICN